MCFTMCLLFKEVGWGGGGEDGIGLVFIYLHDTTFYSPVNFSSRCLAII